MKKNEPLLDELTLKELHDFCSYHRTKLEQVGLGVCFCCESVFSTKKIKEWIDNNNTAICPKCGIDSVLPAKIKEKELTFIEIKTMKVYWFDYGGNESIMEK